MKKMLEDYKDLAKDELKKILKKGDLAATDWDAAQKGFCILKEVLEIENLLGIVPTNEEMYQSGVQWPADRMHYGRAMENYDRSPVTGRFISHNYTNGTRYSGHSMKDRMIARLENKYNTSTNDYERQVVVDLISWVEKEF